MGDSEFEQFRSYFDKLPQYIKAPAHCYSLVPNIDLLDLESPTSSTYKIPTILIPSTSQNYAVELSPTSTVDILTSLSLTNAIEEPFAGDLQLISGETDDGTAHNKNSSFRNSISTTRRRRKLPEVPKRKNEEAIQNHQKHQRWSQRNLKQLSLAEEIFDAEKRLLQQNSENIISDLNNSTQSTAPSCNNRPCCSNCSNNASTNCIPTGNSGIESSSTQNYGSNRPFFLLKFNNHRSSNEDVSSSDSEKYPSLDSGHSTVHSDDGIKQYSSQILSITESFSSTSPITNSRIPVEHLEVLEATHRGLHKFIPRHRDEIEVDIGDPIYVQREADDLWCEGVNLRSGIQGIFPSAYVVDVEYNDFDPSANKVKKERYVLNYLGSIETLYHKGNEVLCQAVKKIASQDNYVATHSRSCILEISDQGIHMVDKGKVAPNHVPCHDYFYALKNVSFCGFHPNDHRYFCFVTKHPTLNRFACHVFISGESTRPVAEAVGRAFQRFYQKFLETAYPIEDIYLE